MINNTLCQNQQHTGFKMLKNVIYSYLIAISLIFLVSSLLSFKSAKAETISHWRVSPRKAKIINPVAADNDSFEKGQKLYQQECSECHGKTGKGDGPEAAELDKTSTDFTQAVIWQQTDGAIFWKIKTGRRPMPGFKRQLNEEQIWHITNYMRASFSPEIIATAP